MSNRFGQNRNGNWFIAGGHDGLPRPLFDDRIGHRFAAGDKGHRDRVYAVARVFSRVFFADENMA